MSEKPIYDFFISYNHKDKNYAEWIAWILEDAGYKTFIQAWDFNAGSNLVLKMQQGTSSANQTIALLSENYLSSQFTQPEWAAAFGYDPTGESRKLITVRIQDIKLEGLLPQIVYIDLVGKSQEDAIKELLEGVQTGRKKPKVPPAFPGVIPRTESPKEVILGEWYTEWIEKRVGELNDNKFASNIIEGPKVVLHIIPLESLRQPPSIKSKKLKQTLALKPLLTSGWDDKFNKDGFCTYIRGLDDKHQGYVQLFKNGIIEAVDSRILSLTNDKFIHYAVLEEQIITHTAKYMSALNALDIKFPYAISITLLNIRDFYVSGNRGYFEQKITEDVLTLPTTVVNSLDTDISKALKDSFDHLWNHCGIEGSLSYDLNGNWKRT